LDLGTALDAEGRTPTGEEATPTGTPTGEVQEDSGKIQVTQKCYDSVGLHSVLTNIIYISYPTHPRNLSLLGLEKRRGKDIYERMKTVKALTRRTTMCV